MFSQAIKIFKTIGTKNQKSAFYLILISFIVIILELLSFTLIIPAISILLDNDSITNVPIFSFVKKLFFFDIENFLTLKNILI